LEIISQIIKELDENPEQERRIFVYPLKNATASNLMTILNNLFTEMRSLNQTSTSGTGQQVQSSQRGGAASGPSGGTSTASSTSTYLSDETYIEADAETNSLLVMTSTKNYEKIKPILVVHMQDFGAVRTIESH
jgi:type II secretory pathway component GspD/PulD (secretin)